jgi:AcrR family transcriptional regulator
LTQRERSDSTIEDLLRVAREQFGLKGYAQTSLDSICDSANVTKGALYHHFTGKRDLFRVVYEREQASLAEVVSEAYREARPDSWEAVFAGARAFLREALRPEVQRISLLDAPGALGWETMREISTDCLRMMRVGIERAVTSGDIAPHSTTALTHLLYGALCETAVAVARAEDKQTAFELSVAELGSFFDAVARQRQPD